ncbi:hypothetical protein ASPSYDRAFT_37036 [Aspergillus sydowii CBS 593.65]|uniref:Uncharacterized protein n=1 Tax=Aspergillus sydowii CBS 593.65 TaxID=1036612 RepID=A0A1L9T0L2_9EURO|nr:uncharacterized protein ASPSYDRAFT_37036 [Aspergillus sydowii CBS 593.65]OJJ52947.1 hypothetical protein ASPSYDRAFT_37036 [Aspergillus sydowii CBS 593.65]
MGSFMQQPEANEAGNGMPPNWRAATKAAKGVQDTIKEMMRKEQVRKEREEREEIVTDLERILDKALRLGVEVSPTALSRVGIEMKHLPLAWEHMIIDPQSLNTDFFFKPMPVEIIREHAPILVPADDSDHVLDVVDSQGPAQNSGDAPESDQVGQGQSSDYDGDVDSNDESGFWDDRGIDDVCPILTPDPEDGGLLPDDVSEEYQAVSSWLTEIEDQVELNTHSPVLDSRADAMDSLHIHTASRVWRMFTELDRQYSPYSSNVIRLVNVTNWRVPLRLQKPHNVFGRYTNADSEITVPRGYTPTHRWFVQCAFVATGGEPHEQFIVASPGPDDFSGGLVHSEIITIFTAMITRYKSGRPYIKRQKVMPVMLISVIRNVVRVVQAHYDGQKVVVRVSQANNPEIMTEGFPSVIFAPGILHQPPLGIPRTTPWPCQIYSQHGE